MLGLGVRDGGNEGGNGGIGGRLPCETPENQAMRSTECRVGQRNGSAFYQAVCGWSLARWASSSSSSAMPVK